MLIAIFGGVAAAQPPASDEPDRAHSPGTPPGKGQSGFSVGFGVLPTPDGAFGVASGRF